MIGRLLIWPAIMPAIDSSVASLSVKGVDHQGPWVPHTGR